MKIDLKKIGGEVFDVAKGSARIAKDKIKDGAEKAKEMDLQDVKTGLQDKAKEAKDKARDMLDSAMGDDEEAVSDIRVLSSEAAILALFYLMAVDGQIHKDEEEKLLDIAKELDPAFAEHKDAIRDVCKKEFDQSLSQEKLYQVIESSVEKLLAEDAPTKDALVTPKILVWDMMTIAYSDGDYSEEEHDLIQFVADKLEVDRAILLELESSMETLSALEKEEQWIKTTNRPYLEIEAHVNEIADRKNVIFQSIQDLVTL